MSYVRRYEQSRISNDGRTIADTGKLLTVRTQLEAGLIEYDLYVTNSSERLETIADKVFGDGRLWWILAALSDVGWALQVPDGTILRVPKNPKAVLSLL